MSLREYAQRFRADERGSSSIEFLLWIPVMVMMLTMTTDATLLMYKQQDMYNAARDAARQVALGQRTDAQARNSLATRVDIDGAVATVEQSNGFVTTKVSAPSSSIAPISGFFVDVTLSAEVSMWVENNES